MLIFTTTTRPAIEWELIPYNFASLPSPEEAYNMALKEFEEENEEWRQLSLWASLEIGP